MDNERQYVTHFGQRAPVAQSSTRRSGAVVGVTTRAGTTIGNAMYPAALGRPTPGEIALPMQVASMSSRSSGVLPRPSWGGGTTTAAEWTSLSDAEQQRRIDAGETTLAVPPQLAGIYSAADWTRLGASGRAAAMEALRPSAAQDIFDAAMRAAGLATTTYLQFNQAENAAAHQQTMDALLQSQQEFQQRLQADAAAGRVPNPADAARLANLETLIARGQNLTATPPPAEEKKGLSTGAIIGIVAGGVVVLGGLAFVLTRPRRNPSRSRRAHRRY